MTTFSPAQLAALQKQANATNTQFREAFQQARTQGIGTLFCFRGYYYSAYTETEFLTLTQSQQQELDRRILERIKQDNSPLTLVENWRMVRKQWGDSPSGAETLHTLSDMLEEDEFENEEPEDSGEEEDAYEHLLKLVDEDKAKQQPPKNK